MRNVFFGDVQPLDFVLWRMVNANGAKQMTLQRGDFETTGLRVPFLQGLPAESRPLVEQTATLLTQAATVAADRERDLNQRLAAVRLLAHAAARQRPDQPQPGRPARGGRPRAAPLGRPAGRQ